MCAFRIRNVRLYGSLRIRNVVNGKSMQSVREIDQILLLRQSLHTPDQDVQLCTGHIYQICPFPTGVHFDFGSKCFSFAHFGCHKL